MQHLINYQMTGNGKVRIFLSIQDVEGRKQIGSQLHC